MTDLEITRLRAKAMGYEVVQRTGRKEHGWWAMELCKHYDPFHDDAQLMELVKKFPMECYPAITRYAYLDPAKREAYDLNRDICECVAKVEGVKHD